MLYRILLYEVICVFIDYYSTYIKNVTELDSCMLQLALIHIASPLYLLSTLQHPGIWHKRNGWRLHSGLVYILCIYRSMGLAALAGRSESWETVHRVGVDCGVVEMVPVHCHSHREWVFVLLCVTVLDVKASVVVSCVGVSWVVCAAVWGFPWMYQLATWFLRS